MEEHATELAQSGHNLYIGGQAGTGKTRLLVNLGRIITKQGKKVQSLASTGIATLRLEQAVTVHSWFGLKDGCYTTDELCQLVSDHEDFKMAKERILTTDTLLIDEVSMVSLKTLEQIEALARHIRRSWKPFGGMQIILSGDFFQLPPVPDPLYGDMGELCLGSRLFGSIHVIKLTAIHRQKAKGFIEAINEASTGNLSQKSTNFLKQLGRPLQYPRTTLPVEIFATNLEVEMHNADLMAAMPGEWKVYHAEDEHKPLTHFGSLDPDCYIFGCQDPDCYVSVVLVYS